MKKENIELTLYRMDRAMETLEEAKLLLDAGHNIATVNRLYYACFYAVQSLLLTDGLSSSKHAGIRSLFNQHWIKTKHLPVTFIMIFLITGRKVITPISFLLILLMSKTGLKNL